MVKVCIVANSAFTVLNFRSELIRKIQYEGGEVIVVCPPRCGLLNGREIPEEFQKIGVTHYSISLTRSGMNPVGEIISIYEMVRIIRLVRPDVVLNYTIKPTIYGSLAARICNVPVIASNITGLGYLFTDKSAKARLLSIIVKMQYKLTLAFNKVVFFQNPDDRDLFTSLGLVGHKKALLINGSGVDTEKFKRVSSINQHIRFLFVGRLLKDKGVKEYLVAANMVKKIYPDAQFTIVGSFDDNPNSLDQKDLHAYEKQGVVKYLGSVTDMVSVYENHNVFVLPSYREGTPRSTLEALSMGMPIITTDAPGCRETVVDGYNGFLVPVRDSQQLAESMLKFFETPGIIEKFSKASREIALTKYDVNAVNKAILDGLKI